MKQSIFSLFQISVCTSGYLCLTSNPSLAQVTSDGTVNTQVNSNGNVAEITGGQTRGGNLFHSFQDFSISTGKVAFFNNANSISNIFSRVMGGNISNIDGAIRANGNANLFLINPAGIIFGENARLDIGGSFYGSSASSILFEDGEFSAADLDNPPLLTINAPVGLGFRDNPGDIVNRSFVQNGAGEAVGLEVLPGKNLTLAGGKINFEAGEITASGGNVELGGLSEAGIVGINQDGSLNFPQNVARADLSLSNASDVDVRGTGGGRITINTRNLNLEAGEFGSSQIRAGIVADSTAVDAQAGNIIINVTNDITIDRSSVANEVDFGAVGNAGSITIVANSLSTANGAQISTSTFGQGNAGSVMVNTESVSLTAGGTVESITTANGNAGSIAIEAQSVEITGNNPINNRSSGLFSSVGLFDAGIAGGAGNGGNLTIITDSLRVTDGGRISADIFGTSTQAKAGSIEIKANSIEVIGFNNQSLSGIFAAVTPSSSGSAGNVVVETENLLLKDGGFISASTFGEGDAGFLTVKAKSIEVTGISTSNVPSRLRANVDFFGDSRSTGNGGDLTIETETLRVAGGAEILANTFADGNAGSINITATDTITFDGEDSNGFPSAAISRVERGAVGDAGGITITTGSLNVINGAKIDASTFGEGNAGTIMINATDTVTFNGEGINVSSSGIDSIVAPRASGNAGGVNITTGSLNVINGAQIDASTFGEGNAGAITINATDTVTFDGEKSDGFASGAFSTVTTIDSSFSAVGDAGGIDISTDFLIAKNGAQISASTFGTGNAGSVNIDAADNVTFDGISTSGSPSGAFSSVASGAVGDAEGVIISTNSLTLTNGGVVSASTFGTGNAGNVTIDANNIDLINGGSIETATQSTTDVSGNINLQVGEDIALRDNSSISAQAFNGANGGNLDIDARFIIAFPDGNNDILASAEQGRGGNIDINAKSLFGIRERAVSNSTNDINASSEFSLDGNITINTPDINPVQGAAELPNNVVVPEKTTQQACAANRQVASKNGLNITGKGGIPAEPGLPLDSLNVSINGESDSNLTSTIPLPIETSLGKIQPARGIKVTETGEVILTAYRTNNSGDRIFSNSINCGRV